jgi:hypothetical protein
MKKNCALSWLFTRIKIILTLPSQYIFCLLQFVVKNRKLFSLNKDLHSINTRQQLNLHQPSAHLKKYQLGPYCMGIKLFNTLPALIKNESHNPVRFRSLLKKFLLEKTLYLLDEFYRICNPRKPWTSIGTRISLNHTLLRNNALTQYIATVYSSFKSNTMYFNIIFTPSIQK